MTASRNTPGSSETLARFTPDSRRWRRLVAAGAAIGGPLAFYAAFAVASGVKTGLVYDLLILLFGILTLVLPAVAAATLLAPNSGLTRENSPGREDPIEVLKRRYAAGEIDREEFDRRLDALVEISESGLDQRPVRSDDDRRIRDEVGANRSAR